MKIHLVERNVEITDALRAALEKKLAKLDRYFANDVTATVVMNVIRGRHVVEITIPFPGGTLRCEESTSDMYASIDSAAAKIERQIRKHRTRLEKRLREGVEIPVPEEPHEEEPQYKIVRNKRFTLQPMDADEAALQLELVGHSFFVFLNVETEKVNVIYRRKDGNYGLIETE